MNKLRFLPAETALAAAKCAQAASSRTPRGGRGQLAPYFCALFDAMKSIAAAILILASLAADAMAQEAPKTGGALIGRFWESIGLRAPAAQAPDFVRDSRPGATEFLPLSPTPGPTKKKTAAEMQALGASLNAAIAANRAKAARVKTPDVASQRRSR